MMALKGRPVQVVVPIANQHKFRFDEKALSNILLDKRVRHCPLAVISVAGAFRKGKSFILNFFLRYLNASGAKDWIGDENAPLEGFRWRSGSERETTGIYIWSEPFIVRTSDGAEVGIILMDTQGTMDSESTVQDWATIFALSALISSVQVFNITSNLQRGDLQFLQYFAEYGRLAMNSTETKPFQKLLFLIRDWQYPYQHPFGTKGGDDLVSRILQQSVEQHPELQGLRKHIKECFSEIICFLMPHPGLQVATSESFNGRLSDINRDFIEHAQDLASLLLSKENIVIKQVNGSSVTGQDLLQYFKVYAEVFQGDKLPKPVSVFQATAEANNLLAKSKAKNVYLKEMSKICGGNKPFLEPRLLQREHDKAVSMAIHDFRSKRKMGGTEFDKQKELESELGNEFARLQKFNEGKLKMTFGSLLVSQNFFYTVAKLILVFVFLMLLYTLVF